MKILSWLLLALSLMSLLFSYLEWRAERYEESWYWQKLALLAGFVNLLIVLF